jgi:hypothetical protein
VGDKLTPEALYLAMAQVRAQSSHDASWPYSVTKIKAITHLSVHSVSPSGVCSPLPNIPNPHAHMIICDNCNHPAIENNRIANLCIPCAALYIMDRAYNLETEYISTLDVVMNDDCMCMLCYPLA